MKKVLAVALLVTITVGGGCYEKVNFNFSKKREIKISCVSASCSNRMNILLGNCIATYYQEDGDKYITEQEHLVCSCENTLYMTSFEPDGEMIVKCRENTGFNIIKGDLEEKVLSNKEVCEAIYTLLIANSQAITIDSPVVNMYGQWYAQADSMIPTVKKYVGSDSNVVDMAEVYKLVNGKMDKVYVAKAFDYIKVDGVKLPRIIEIFESGGEKVLGSKVIKLDYSEFTIK